MYAFLALAILSLGDGSSVTYREEDIAAKTKIPLSPVEIICSPNDVIILTSPEVNYGDALYRLYKPNGDVINANSSKRKTEINIDTDVRDSNIDNAPSHSNMVVKYITRDIKSVYAKRMYKVLTLDNSDLERDDVLKKEEGLMKENDFVIGPLLEEDHGNWVLSVYCKDIDGAWIEMFQVITITLITTVQMKKSNFLLKEGSTLNLSFKYPIKDLKTCELTVPWGSTDRYFDRNRIELGTCGYIVTNITKQDHGTWRVIGVGKIVYEGTASVNVVDNDTPEYNIIAYEEYNDATYQRRLDREQHKNSNFVK